MATIRRYSEPELLNQGGADTYLFLRRSTSDHPRDIQVNRNRCEFRHQGRIFHPGFGGYRTVVLIARLYGRLQWWLRFPGKWLVQFVRLLAFVVCMLPGFVPRFIAYLLSPNISKNIVYGPHFRNQLDVYWISPACPTSGVAPVVIFVSGGAWIIGYKAWGFLMGQAFQQQGVIFVALDYRNFPQATVSTMVDDVSAGISWVYQNLGPLGGDPNNVTLMGQSAGSHLSIMALIQHAKMVAKNPAAGENVGWTPGSFARWCGISGPYDIPRVLPNMRKRGLPTPVIYELMEGDLNRFSPSHCILELQRNGSEARKALELLPPCYLYHGNDDRTVSHQQTLDFAEVLAKAGIRVEHKLYDGKSHTDPILEDPCDFGKDDALMIDLLTCILPADQRSKIRLEKPWRLQPLIALRLARLLNPF